MAGSPPPEDTKKADAEARAKEQAEQAALPYKWDQTIKDLDITISIDAKYKGKDLDVKIGRNTLKAGIKGQEPFIDACSATPPSLRVQLTSLAGRPSQRRARRRLHMDPVSHVCWQGH
jgi:hypothetical protein